CDIQVMPVDLVAPVGGDVELEQQVAALAALPLEADFGALGRAGGDGDLDPPRRAVVALAQADLACGAEVGLFEGDVERGFVVDRPCALPASERVLAHAAHAGASGAAGASGGAFFEKHAE